MKKHFTAVLTHINVQIFQCFVRSALSQKTGMCLPCLKVMLYQRSWFKALFAIG